MYIYSGRPLPEVRPSQEYPLHINLDTGSIYDGDADNNFFLLPFDDVDIYCSKEYGVELQLAKYTDGRAKQIIDYIRTALLASDSVELWNVYLIGYWEFDDKPYIHKRTVHIGGLTVNDIREINEAENWNNKDKTAHRSTV